MIINQKEMTGFTAMYQIWLYLTVNKFSSQWANDETPSGDI